MKVYSSNRNNGLNGFTLLELIAVIAGLGILASLAIPNFLKYLEFAQVDEAKSLLNAAASECLQKYRSDPDNWSIYEPEVLKNRSLPGSYSYVIDKATNSELKTCSQIAIHDVKGENGESTLLPMLSFTIANGKVIKESINYHPESERDCKSWGNCGGSPQAQSLKKCSLDQEACDKAFQTALALAKDGPLNAKGWRGTCTWPETDCGCDKEAWSCNNVAYFTLESFTSCIDRKAGAACKARRASIQSITPPFTGEDTSGACKNTEYYLDGNWIGEDKSAWELAKAEKASKQAKINENLYLAEKQNWINAGVSGKFSPTISGFPPLWGCKNTTIFTVFDNELSYNDSCNPKPIDLPTCLCPYGKILIADRSRCGLPSSPDEWINGPSGVNCKKPGLRVNQ